MRWRKSSYSQGNGQCVELGTDDGSVIALRNSQHPSRGTVTFTAPAVAAFVRACAAGELDPAAN